LSNLSSKAGARQVQTERRDPVYVEASVGCDLGEPERKIKMLGGGHRLWLGLQSQLAEPQVVNLLAEVQARLGVALVFIAHDLAVVRHVSHRVAVMYLGRLAELGPATTVYERPAHPYTRALLSAVPITHPRERGRQRIMLPGDPPSPVDPPAGCRFHTRCPRAEDPCRATIPEFSLLADRHAAACHFAGEVVLDG
jgi:oligopeptide transport system ATP-binding protein